MCRCDMLWPDVNFSTLLEASFVGPQNKKNKGRLRVIKFWLIYVSSPY